MHGVIGAGVILSVMGGGVFTNVLAAPNAWPTEVLAPLFVCAGITEVGLDSCVVPVAMRLPSIDLRHGFSGFSRCRLFTCEVSAAHGLFGWVVEVQTHRSSSGFQLQTGCSCV